MTSEDWNAQGQAALDEEQLERAVECFSKAAELQPDWSVPHYNLGLSHKFLKNWRQSKEANLRAHQLAPEDDASYWNLAISSVADGDWKLAARAFQAIGLTIPDSEPPWNFRWGLVPIRVNPEESAEVVWCHRLDPVRAQIANIPFPQCGRRFGDVVLNDGAPNGFRELRGQEVPVFDELTVLEASPFQTYEMELRGAEEQELERLMTLFEEYRVPAENWSTSVRFLCRACSEGRPHDDHDDERVLRDGSYHIGLAALEEAPIREVLERWNGKAEVEFQRVL